MSDTEGSVRMSPHHLGEEHEADLVLSTQTDGARQSLQNTHFFFFFYLWTSNTIRFFLNTPGKFHPGLEWREHGLVGCLF